MTLYLFDNDLFFISKIRVIAPDVIVTKDQDTLLQVEKYSLIVVNLEFQTDLLFTVFPLLPKNIQLVGYCSHMNVELMKKAQSFGVTVYPRSVFVKNLPEILKG